MTSPDQTVRQRACDACRIRKVKCVGSDPCSACSQFNVSCTVSAATRRKNPVRGRLVARARGESANSLPPGSDSLKDSELPSGNSTLSPVSPLLPYSAGFLRGLVPAYAAMVYIVNPVISPEEIHAAIDNMETSVEDSALIWAFAAVTMFLLRKELEVDDDFVAETDGLMIRSLDAHRQLSMSVDKKGRLVQSQTITIKRIMTCIFLEVSMMAFKRFERSFELLREAITMIQAYRLRHLDDDSQHNRQLERVYWEAYIHERFLTIAAGYPSILPPLESGNLISDPKLPAHVQLGFNRLINLFLVVDQQFLTCAGEQARQEAHLSSIGVNWIEAKQAELDKDEADALWAEQEAVAQDPSAALTEFQRTDILVTRLWLRTVLWQLALSRGLLQSTPLSSTHDGLSLRFPAERIFSQLRTLVGCMESFESISVQGSGIIQKLFEITSTIGDVLVLPPPEGRDSLAKVEQVEDFAALVHFLLGFQRVRDEQKTYLRERLDYLYGIYAREYATL